MSEQKFHQTGGLYLRDFVYGATDGIVTTFAVVAGVAGADLAPVTVILLGVASLFADGFSMATSSFLAVRSARAVFQREEGVEKWEIAHTPAAEVEEVRTILRQKKYSPEDVEKMTELIIKNKPFWIDFMMHHELNLGPIEAERPLRGAVVTFFAFILAGFLPVLPYFFISGPHNFWLASLSAAIVFFVVGALRTIFIAKSWLLAGFEMMIVGGLAATIAYGVGALMKAFIG